MTRTDALDAADPGIAGIWALPWGRQARFAFGWGQSGQYVAIRFSDGEEITCRWNEKQAAAEYGACPLDPPDVAVWTPERVQPAAPVDRLGAARPPKPRLSPFED